MQPPNPYSFLRTALTLCLPSWDAQESKGLTDDDHPLQTRILAKMISVQLLAGCFTPPQNLNTLTLPAGRYYNKNQTDGNLLNTRLVSSLRQHTQWKHSPAFGHQARNNSAASLWPEKDDSMSREALLADRVSLSRRLRQSTFEAAEGSMDQKWRCQSELSGGKHGHRRLFPSRHGRRLGKPDESASSHQSFQGRSASRPGVSIPRGKIEQRNVLKVIRGSRVRDVSDDGHRWSLEPIVRSEEHPIFVQPVKDYVMKRWRVFRSGSRNRPCISVLSEGNGERPFHQRAVSSNRKDPQQLKRRPQIMTTFEASMTSLAQPAPDAEASSSAPTGIERTLASAEASQICTNHAHTTAKLEPLIAVEHSYEDMPMGSAGFSPPTNWVPHHSFQRSESDQIRNRTSTSETTGYNPPSIAEASPNVKKLESEAPLLAPQVD